ncbi:hypothetical protein M422DRAFT_258496 [Sphaerobolus stellatus SS14]|uniref:RRM domain-containing protein n=1 Tax=Sphaerobolus stellatus (strain SS14) TaxID=990650 RepID=A0A0C9VLY1_SPHS4|nr:hypothetical protein M422DRAFT_258496 [Sphaerobolus stellatus SS14]
MYVSTLTHQLRPEITPRYLRAESTSSCNIPPPFPAAIATACSTNTPNPLQCVSRLLMAHRHDVLTEPPPYKSTACTSKPNNSTRSPHNSALSSAVALLLVNRPITHPGMTSSLSHSFHPVLSHLILLHLSFPFDPTVIPLYPQTPLTPLPSLLSTTCPQDRALAAPHQHNEPAPARRRLRPRTRTRAFYLVSAFWPWLVDFEFVYWDADGLPINIDVPTLRVLVAPHVICGSQFFADTRLQPPQLVAYIQLDNCAAAQDIRNKLHGRSIRGYSGRLQVVIADEAMLAAIYQDIYAAPQAPHQQDTNNNNVGGSGNVHNATGARHGHPNTNVNANGNGVGGGGGYQSQRQSPEGIAVGGAGGVGRMSMGGGYGISVEPLLHTLQGLGIGARHDPTHTLHRIRNSPAPSPAHQRNAKPTPDATFAPCSLSTLTPITPTPILTLLLTAPPPTTASTPTHILTTLNLNLTQTLQALTSNLSPFPTAIHILTPLPPPRATPSTAIPPPTPIRRPSILIVCVVRARAGRGRV